MSFSFESQIQQWVSIDNQLRIVNDKAKELRESKNALCKNITAYVEQQNLSNATVQISDGKLKFVETKIAAPLTYRHLEKCLAEIIKNESQVRQIVDYLKQKREIKIVPEIKRF